MPATSPVVITSEAAFLAAFEPDPATGTSEGRWRFDASGSSASGGTGPSDNNALSFMHTETSSSTAEQIETNSVAQFAVVPVAQERTLHLRLCLQGEDWALALDGNDGTDVGMAVEHRDSDSGAWTRAALIHGWASATSRNADDTLTDFNGDSLTVAVDGGWVDFEVAIPNTATQVRLKQEVNRGDFREDAALRQFHWTWPGLAMEARAGAPTAAFNLRSVGGDRSLFDAGALNPGVDGDKGVRWSLALTTFATTPNATRAHIVANNQLAGGVTPATFQDQGGNDKRIDWFVLHHGNDFVILNLNSSITNDSEVDFRVAFRENGGTGLWDYAVSSDASDSDPYELPATQADLDAIVAVITGGGTLDTIIYDVSVASGLPEWDGAALTYTDPEPLSMAARAGDPTAAFNLTAITANLPPVVSISTGPMTLNAGDRIQVVGVASDPDGSIADVSWSGGGTFDNDDAATTHWTAPSVPSESAFNLVFRATDDDGASSISSVQMTVRADPARLAMAARAGNPTADFDLTALAAATTVMVNAGADASVQGNREETYQISDASVTVENAVGATTYLWERIAGPHSADLDDTAILNPTVQNTRDVSVDTVITFRLTATNNGVSASDTIRITITPDLRAPMFEQAMGADQSWTVNDIAHVPIPRIDGNPNPVITEAGLPPGTINAGSLITGRVTAPGSGTVTVTATNSEGTDTWSFDWTVAPLPVQQLSMEARAGDPTAAFDLRAIAQNIQRLSVEAEAGDPTAAFNLTAIGPPVELSMAARAGAPTATFGLLREVQRRVRFSHANNVGTNLDHHPDGMYTDTSVFWLGEIEIHEVAGGVVEIAIDRGGSAVSAADFFATWTGRWALYLVDETSREYVAIRARLIHSADQERIAWRSPTWQVVATNVDADDVPQWVLGVVGTLQVAIAPFDDYRPYS